MLNRMYTWYGRKTVLIVVVVIVLLVVTVLLSRGQSPEMPVQESDLKSVTVASVASLSNENTISLIGSVESQNQVLLETEASGRVTSVSYKLGDTVPAGAVIAQLENANARAAVLQAEGAYEAALAGAASSDISLQSAFETAKTTYTNIFITADDTIKNLADELFSNPSSNNPGLRIDGKGNAPRLNTERVALGVILAEWSSKLNSITEENAEATLIQTKSDVERILAFIEELSALVSNASNENSPQYTAAELSSLKTRFLAARTNLNNRIISIESAIAALDQAKLSSTGQEISSAGAAVKQALGSLRAAQANLEKTIIRTPIAGTINQLDIQTGDFVSAFTRVVTVANNNAIEITTYVGDDDRNQIAVDDEVIIEGSIVGFITAIAPAVDSVTRKVEVKINTESDLISNGDTVSLRITPDTDIATSDSIRVPLTSVKLTSDKAFVFTVEDGVLKEHEVVLGKPNGSTVTILEGITQDWNIVVDARGLIGGREVSVITD